MQYSIDAPIEQQRCRRIAQRVPVTLPLHAHPTMPCPNECEPTPARHLDCRRTVRDHVRNFGW